MPPACLQTRRISCPRCDRGWSLSLSPAPRGLACVCIFDTGCFILGPSLQLPLKSNRNRITFEHLGEFAVCGNHKACFIVFGIHRKTEKCTSQTEYSCKFRFQKSLSYGNSPLPSSARVPCWWVVQLRGGLGPSRSSVGLTSCPSAMCSGACPAPLFPVWCPASPNRGLAVPLHWGREVPHTHTLVLVTFIAVIGFPARHVKCVSPWPIFRGVLFVSN